MQRLLCLVALSIVVLSATLLLRAQQSPPKPPGDDPFGGAPAFPAKNPPADPFAPVPAAAAPAAPEAKAESPPVGKNWPAGVAASSQSGMISFADESLGKEVLQKMTPAERMAYYLNRPATINIHETKLEGLVDELSQKLHVNTELDTKALSEAGFDLATPIQWSMTHPANLGASLRRMLHSKSLDYVRLDDTLQITTRNAFENKRFVKTYNLDREMFRPKTAAKHKVEVYAQAVGGAAGGALAPGSNLFGQGGFYSNSGDEDSLVDIIQLIQPTTWIEHGSSGVLHLDLKRSLLVVNQRQDVHDEIEVLLGDLRKVARSNQQAIQANAQLERRVVFRLKIPEKQAGPAQPFDGGGNFIPLEPAFTMKEVAELIKQQVEPHTWKDEKHTITILGECLIINQSEAVQTKIHQFLKELGITRQQHDENNRSFNGFS